MARFSARHREELGVYYGRRSFAKAGGLFEILSRRNSKETTLDYVSGGLYRQALRFAELRGLQMVNFARTVARDRLDWMIWQRSRLADLARQLAVIGAKLGLAAAARSIPNAVKDAKPMVTGIKTFPKSTDQAVGGRVAADLARKKQWDEVSMRFHHVCVKPESAFKAVNVDAMLRDQATAAKTIARIVREPQSFGALRAKNGLLANRGNKLDRDRALRNVTPLSDSITDYLRQRVEASQGWKTVEIFESEA